LRCEILSVVAVVLSYFVTSLTMKIHRVKIQQTSRERGEIFEVELIALDAEISSTTHLSC
jgi:hypothetical protein